jgi:hypothetical protein
LTIVACNPKDVRGAVKGFTAMASLMARFKSASIHGMIANDLRDAADAIEYPMDHKHLVD